MKILSIGTSGKNCTVAISEDKKIISEININNGITHSENLLPAIKKLLDNTKLSLNDIDYYATSIGPGSFTGLRIGIATIKGLALGLYKKVIPVPTLLSYCYNMPDFKGIIISGIDARNDNLYAAIYNTTDTHPKIIGDYYTNNVYSIIDSINEIIIKPDYSNLPILVIGEGMQNFKNIFLENIKSQNINYASDNLNLEYASSIAKCSYDLLQDNICIDSDDLVPLYLKKSQAERELESKN